jgi:hypothetical protein
MGMQMAKRRKAKKAAKPARKKRAVKRRRKKPQGMVDAVLGAIRDTRRMRTKYGKGRFDEG